MKSPRTGAFLGSHDASRQPATSERRDELRVLAFPKLDFVSYNFAYTSTLNSLEPSARQPIYRLSVCTRVGRNKLQNTGAGIEF